MTREEAIWILDPETYQETMCETEYYAGFSGQEAKAAAFGEACRIAAAALRAWQSTAKLDRSRWTECDFCGNRVIEKVMLDYGGRYCTHCGRPLTEEAWAELERRVEKT